MIALRALLAVVALLASGCGPALAYRTGSSVSPDAVDFAPRIDDEAAWRVLAASPGREMVAHTEVVKVIIDLDDGWRPYFLQSRRWEIHYFFAERYLSSVAHPVEDHAAFNAREYRAPDRRFILGTVAHYRDPDIWTFELIAGDTLDAARTIRAFQIVRDHVFVGSRLRYRPVPPDHEAHLEVFRAANVPIATTQQIYGALQFQPINPGEAFGYLRFVHGEPDPAHVRRNDIVVLDTVPLDLPVCAGVITQDFQTPLSHVAVLASNRGTPDMALRDATRNTTLRGLEGRLVRLHVTPQEWSIAPASQSDAERAWNANRPSQPFEPPLALDDVGLPDVRTLGIADLRTVGAKAAQLGELAHIGPPVTTPRAFALPFHAYHDHLVRNHLDTEIASMLADPHVQQDPVVREHALATLRDHIAAAPVDPALLAALRARFAQVFPGVQRVRFRSSTNAEDLPGFNGAGLYRSVVVPVNGTDAQLADGLRAVWSSVWSFPGFEERAYFRIDPSRVAMGVLVQESIDDDVVDGVAITANPFNEGRPGLFINVQVAGEEGGAVTSARGDTVPEQIIYYTNGAEREFERLSRSSLTHGAPVLTDEEVYQLSFALRAIQLHFVPIGDDPHRTMDCEFILAGPTRRVVFVQARPFTVRYDEGRTMATRPGG